MWFKLTRPQKVFYALLALNGEIDNGGVWQFLFNEPELCACALEAIEEVGEKKLLADYQRVISELANKAKTVAEIRKNFQAAANNTRKWEAFCEGYDAELFEDRISKYFYTVTFKKSLFKKICDYVEDNLIYFATFLDG